MFAHTVFKKYFFVSLAFISSFFLLSMSESLAKKQIGDDGVLYELESTLENNVDYKLPKPGPSPEQILALQGRRSESDQSIGFFDDSDRLGRYTDNLATKNQRSLGNAGSWKNDAKDEYGACVRDYTKIYQGKGLVMNIVYGYSDYNSSTVDAELFETTIETLQRSCSFKKQTLCGFKLQSGANSQRATLLKKVSTSVLPEMSELKMKINVYHSSVARSDSGNFRGSEISSEQRRATRISEDAFFGAIRGKTLSDKPEDIEKCNICVYYGHARDGGGPDFGPVPYSWRDSDGHIDYSLFHKYRKNYKKLLQSLDAAKEDPPVLVSLFACYSHSHFYEKYKVCHTEAPGCEKMSLSKFTGKTGFILSRDYSWFENWEKTFGGLMDTVLGLKCGSALKTNFNNLKGLSEHPESYGIYGQFLQ